MAQIEKCSLLFGELNFIKYATVKLPFEGGEGRKREDRMRLRACINNETNVRHTCVRAFVPFIGWKLVH